MYFQIWMLALKLSHSLTMAFEIRFLTTVQTSSYSLKIGWCIQKLKFYIFFTKLFNTVCLSQTGIQWWTPHGNWLPFLAFVWLFSTLQYVLFHRLNRIIGEKSHSYICIGACITMITRQCAYSNCNCSWFIVSPVFRVRVHHAKLGMVIGVIHRFQLYNHNWEILYFQS